jgi:hypothetical protein
VRFGVEVLLTASSVQYLYWGMFPQIPSYWTILGFTLMVESIALNMTPRASSTVLLLTITVSNTLPASQFY